VVAALAQIGDAASEPALLRWLVATDSVPMKIGVARALAQVGTVAAVEPLLPLTKGLLSDGDLKRTARAAIDTIQARLGDVEAGRLSISELARQDGALSLATEGGELSMAAGNATAGGELSMAAGEAIASAKGDATAGGELSMPESAPVAPEERIPAPPRALESEA
jgi:HEAT repeat protein